MTVSMIKLLFVSIAMLALGSEAKISSKFNQFANVSSPSQNRASNRERPEPVKEFQTDDFFSQSAGGINLKAYQEARDVQYDTCSAAWNNIIYWLVLFYGDFYANNGNHILVYYLYTYVVERIPGMIAVCFPNGYV